MKKLIFVLFIFLFANCNKEQDNFIYLNNIKLDKWADKWSSYIEIKTNSYYNIKVFYDFGYTDKNQCFQKTIQKEYNITKDTIIKCDLLNSEYDIITIECSYAIL
jgi:hypothetical protein